MLAVKIIEVAISRTKILVALARFIRCCFSFLQTEQGIFV